jgi:hypothetical protein
MVDCTAERISRSSGVIQSPGGPVPLHMAFSIDTYSRIGGRLDLSGLDLKAGFQHRPLGPGALGCLQYMHDIEHHTVCYLRDLLVTRAHQDPDITTFLTIWNYEEHWHGEAIGEVLEAHGRPNGAARVAAMRSGLEKKDRFRPLWFILGSGLVPDMAAVHMVWGAVNEWTTQAGYSLLTRREDHPVLTELLKRIMKQEGRHIDFYATQARARLDESKATQRLTRWALRKYWHPVGHGVRPEAETRQVIEYLFAGAEGMAAAERIDRNIDRMPGLAGLHLIKGVVENYRAAA